MLNRDKIKDLVHHRLEYLPDRWDKALIGFAESGGAKGTILPCYGYAALKFILKEQGHTPAQVYVKLQCLLNNLPTEAPLILNKYNRSMLWKLITDNKYPHWEHLDRAIIGIGTINWEPTGVVYNKVECINILSTIQQSTSSGSLQEISTYTKQLETSIIPLDLGDNTPWYLTPLG